MPHMDEGERRKYRGGDNFSRRLVRLWIIIRFKRDFELVKRRQNIFLGWVRIRQLPLTSFIDCNVSYVAPNFSALGEQPNFVMRTSFRHGKSGERDCHFIHHQVRV